MYKKIFVVVMALAVLLTAKSAYAVTPSLVATDAGSGSATLTVTGDANSPVILNFVGTSLVSQATTLGNTNSSGSFTATISGNTYSILYNSVFYVTVNNQQSNSLMWTFSNTSGGSFLLSPNSLNINAGQSATVSSNVGSVYLYSNSNPSIASASINGSQITVMGGSQGSTSMIFCQNGSSTNCPTLTVTVGGTNVSTLSFSQNSLTLTPAQNVFISISGGTGSYAVTSNSNSNIVQANINGSGVNLIANNNGYTGTATITVCSTNLSSCGNITASVGTTSNSSSLSFSQTNPNIAVGQVSTVAILGGSGTYYVSSNSNTNVLQTSVSNNIITLQGIANGTATVTACASNGGCGTLNVTVGSVASLAMSPTSLNLTVGQNSSVSISGNGGYYITSNSNSSVASAVVSGNYVSVGALNPGNASVVVCQTGGQCLTLPITVVAATNNSSNSSLTLANVITVGQGMNLTISGGTAPYSVSSNNSSVFSASISNGNVLTIYGVGVGSGSANVCAASGGCTTVNVVVLNSTTPSGSGNSNSGTTGGGKFVFSLPLKVGSVGDEVTELQQKLLDEGFYSGPVTGRFGALTEAAVKKYQRQHGLSPLGNVGPGTRAALNGE